MCHFAELRYSVRRIRLEPDATPSRPSNIFAQTMATSTAVLREMTYWQPWNLSGRFTQFFTPPTAGRCLVLAIYWLILLIMLWNDTILAPSDPMYAYKWEKVGFRAAWVSITQIPFIYLLATKLNPISLLSGISYERLNWFHRWASRTLFITVIFHWSYFFTEWSIADFVQFEIQSMTMVTYGFAAWGVIGWMVLTSFGFFRSLCYELWVLQHLAATGALLWLLFMHVPAYAAYNLWMAIAFIAFDQIGRRVWDVVQNVGLFHRGSKGLSLGYIAALEAMPDGFTKVRIPNVHFSWKAGQHLYLSIPRLGPIEAHPFTIANDPQYDQSSNSRTINLLIKAHGGFSRRLLKNAQKFPKRSYRAFVSGPWGIPPNLSSFETIIFIANSTGATYTLPLFQEVAKKRGCAKNVVFSWICRESCQISWFQNQILDASDEITANGATVSVRIGCTDGSKQLCCCCGPAAAREVDEKVQSADEKSLPDSEKSDPASPPKKDKATTTVVTKVSSSEDPESSAGSAVSVGLENPSQGCICALRTSSVTSLTHAKRPSLDSIILPAVEGAKGETAIICCGRKSLTADVRNYVARLSDERAVHKGTGAQGIFLWCEELGW